MKATTLYAAKDLVIEGTEIKKGQQVAVVTSDVPLDRLSAGLQNGAFTPEAPAGEVPPAEPAPTPAAPPAPAAPKAPPAAKK